MLSAGHESAQAPGKVKAPEYPAAKAHLAGEEKAAAVVSHYPSGHIALPHELPYRCGLPLLPLPAEPTAWKGLSLSPLRQ